MIDKNTLPAIELSDAEGWKKSRDANTDPYGKAGLDFAELWARLMQKQINEGKKLEDIAQTTSHEADEEGITGFMYGCAVSILAQTWKYGPELKRWHNGEYSQPDAKGTVNPALISIR